MVFLGIVFKTRLKYSKELFDYNVKNLTPNITFKNSGRLFYAREWLRLTPTYFLVNLNTTLFFAHPTNHMYG